MRNIRTLAVTMAVGLALTGCSTMQQREWGSCTVAGAALGAVAGGIAGGAAVNNGTDDKNDAKRAAGIGGGIAGGALVGGLLGHLLCDPLIEEPIVQAQAPAPPPAGTEILEIRGTHFAFDSATLTAEGEAELAAAVSTLNTHADITVRCDGHTDSVGDEAYNQQLGQRRADAVRQHLVDAGIDGSRITANSLGESSPAASNDTAEGRAQNRRVEIIVN